MPRTQATDAEEQKLLDDIREYGWHCIGVVGDHKHEPFTYTIGLFQSYGHPELLVYGLPRDIAHSVLAIAAEAAATGTPIDLDKPTDMLLEGYPCVFVPVPLVQYAEHVGFARWYYAGDSFPVQQVVWPSKDGLFPWHPHASLTLRAMQPVLGQRESGA